MSDWNIERKSIMTIHMRPAKRYIDRLVSGETAYVRLPLDSVEEHDEFKFSFEPNYSGCITARAEKIQKVRLSDMTRQEVLDEGFDNPEFCCLGRTCGLVMRTRTQDETPERSRAKARENLEELCRQCVMGEAYEKIFMRHFGEAFLGRTFEDDPDGIRDLMVKKVRFSVIHNSLHLILKPKIHLH
jgi:hypothetical protein